MMKIVMQYLVLLAFMFAQPVWSQERSAGERLLEQQKRHERVERLTGASAGQEIKIPKMAGVVAEQTCFPVNVIHLTGVSILKGNTFDALLAEFEKQCLGQASIGNLLQRISAIYADKGYITSRAYVPVQDLASQELTIEVLEGKVEAFIYQQIDNNGNPRPGKPRKIKSAMPLQAGDVFQLRHLEHGLEQMNRLRSSQANANLVAGDEPGTSRIVISEQKADTVRGTFGGNTRGSAATGRTQVSFGIEADDVLRFNDSWSLSYSGSEHSNALAFGFTAPYRKWDFSLNGSYSEELTQLSEASDLFAQTASVNLTAERLVFRDMRSKYFAYGMVSNYRNERFINLAALTPQHRSALRLGLRQEHRLKRAALSADTSLSFGSRIFEADWDAANLPKEEPRTDFTKLESRLTYIRPLKNGSQITATLVGQLSDAPLFSNEQISVGGWESVRGYAGHSFSGDSGAFLRTELSFPPKSPDAQELETSLQNPKNSNLRQNIKGEFRPFLFFDVGHAKARATQESSTVFSTGLGFSARLGNSTFNGGLAIPLTTQNGQSPGSIQAYFGLMTKLF
jgi:hemolysin activation/secretion protein